MVPITGEQEEELRRSKLIDEEKTEFLSIASYEIKTPITIIKAYTQMAKGLNDQCSDRIKGILNKLDSQASKLLSLVQQLLDISKIENGNLQYSMEPVAFNPFVSDMVAIIQHILPHHKVTVALPEPVEVRVDKIRMEQVFSNLLGNAAKYSNKSILIKINCSLEGEKYVRVAVTDQGIGISAASLESIFYKFYREKDVIQTHSGLGMGLYIASKIITDHGGRIWAESVNGAGSTFFFTITYQQLSEEA